MFLNAEEWQHPIPVIEEFSTQKYKEYRWDPILRSYSLGHVGLTPSHEWIVFAINSNLSAVDRSEVVAFGACHVSSDRKRQLVFSPSLGHPAQTARLVIGLHSGFVPLGGNRIGIVTERFPADRTSSEQSSGSCMEIGPDRPEAEGSRASARVQVTYSLWEWDLDRDIVRHVGAWNYAMLPIVQVLQLGQCYLSWSLAGEATSGELSILDLASCNRTMVRLSPEVYVSESSGETYAPTADPCAFAVCAPSPPDSVRVYCVDPNASNGIRWTWGKDAQKDAVGGKIEEAAFLQNVQFPCRELPLLVYSLIGQKYFVRLVFLDARTGKSIRQNTISIDVLALQLPIISGNNKRLVANISGLSNPDQQSDPLESDSCTRLRVIDLESGKYRDTENIYERLQLCWLRGFLDNDRAILSDEHAVWLLDTERGLRLEEFFRLNEVDRMNPGENE